MMPRVPLCTLAALVLAPSSSVLAQRGLDRGLTRSPPRVEPAAETRLGVAAEAPDTVGEANWLLQPLGSFSGSDNDVGLLAGYKNTDRYGPREWKLTVRGVRRHADGADHFRYQLDGEFYLRPRKLGKVGLQPLFTGTHAQTFDVGHSELLAAELDVVLPTPESLYLSVGPVVYYGWDAPRGGDASDGAFAGLVGFLEQGRFALQPEYDFSSDFAGGDSYSVAAWCRLWGASDGLNVKLRGGWEKGDTYSIRLEVGVPDNHPRSPPPTRF
jgi:hypothetical protein